MLIEQLCRHALLSPYQQTMLAAATVQRHGDAALQASLLPRIVAGATCAPALVEGNGGPYGEIATTTDGATLSGSKRYVDFGASSDLHLVAATRDGEPGLALVARDQPGVSTRALTGIGLTPQAEVTYDGASVEGWIGGAEAVDYLRVLGSAIASLECYAHAQKALDMTVSYVQVRVAFGRPIGTFEAVQGRVADAAVGVTASRFLAYEQLYKLDQGELDALHAAKVKSVVSRSVTDATNWGHVLHGGVGLHGGVRPAVPHAPRQGSIAALGRPARVARRGSGVGLQLAGRTNAEDEPWRRCWIRSRAKRSTRTR